LSSPSPGASAAPAGDAVTWTADIVRPVAAVARRISVLIADDQALVRAGLREL
jgi:hypothetical protein